MASMTARWRCRGSRRSTSPSSRTVRSNHDRSFVGISALRRAREHVNALPHPRPTGARAEALPIQFIGHGAERVAGRAEFTEQTERPLFIGVRFERAPIGRELGAEGDAADPFAARLFDRE